MAPLVSSSKEDQFDTAVVDQVSAPAQTQSHQNTVSALCTLVTSKAPKPTQWLSGPSAGPGHGTHLAVDQKDESQINGFSAQQRKGKRS